MELLVSLMLLGLVLSLVYGAFNQISGPALTQRDELTERQELRLLMRLMVDDLQSAQWLERYAARGAQFRTGIVAAGEILEGKEFSRVALHAAVPARFHRGFDPARDPRLHELGYQVRLSENRDRLELVRREDFYLDDDLERGGIEVVLTDHVEAFTVEFLPIRPSDSPQDETWETRWDSPTREANSRMPLAIRVTIARKSAAGKTFREALEFNLPGSLKL